MEHMARDPLKDAESRVRALTREVGSLREDLRRETKRRERAVAQSQEAETARTSNEHKVHELTYANRKLAAEVEAAHAAAKLAGERDRRALRTLREGLTEIEGEVAQRAERGSMQVASAFGHINTLRTLLLGCADSGSECVLPYGLANMVTHCMADIVRVLSALSALLTNASDAQDQAAAALGDGGPGIQKQATHGGQHRSVKEIGAAMLADKLDLEKEGLRDEVHRLRAQLRTLMEGQCGAASAAALALQSQLRNHVAAAEAMQADLQTQIKEREELVEALQTQLQREARTKEAEDKGVHTELLARLHEQASEADALRGKLEVLQRSLAAAEAICKESATATEALSGEVHAQAARAEAAETAQKELQAQLKEQTNEAQASRDEVKKLHQALQAMGHEGKALRAELECMQQRMLSAEAAGAGDAAAVAELRAGHDAAVDHVHSLQQKLAWLQESEAAAKKELESTQLLLAEREALLAKSQSQVANQAALLASLQATIDAQSADMTRALSLVTQNHAHSAAKASARHAPASLTYRHQSHSHSAAKTCLSPRCIKGAGTSQQHDLHHQHPPPSQLHHPHAHAQQQEQPCLLPPPNFASSSPRAHEAALNIGIHHRQDTCMPLTHSSKPPSPQQELEHLLQLQRVRQQNMVTARTRASSPPQPPRAVNPQAAADPLLPAAPTSSRPMPTAADAALHTHPSQHAHEPQHTDLLQPYRHAATSSPKTLRSPPLGVECSRSPMIIRGTKQLWKHESLAASAGLVGGTGVHHAQRTDRLSVSDNPVAMAAALASCLEHGAQPSSQNQMQAAIKAAVTDSRPHTSHPSSHSSADKENIPDLERTGPRHLPSHAHKCTSNHTESTLSPRHHHLDTSPLCPLSCNTPQSLLEHLDQEPKDSTFHIPGSQPHLFRDERRSHDASPSLANRLDQEPKASSSQMPHSQLRSLVDQLRSSRAVNIQLEGPANGAAANIRGSGFADGRSTQLGESKDTPSTGIRNMHASDIPGTRVGEHTYAGSSGCGRQEGHILQQGLRPTRVEAGDSSIGGFGSIITTSSRGHHHSLYSRHLHPIPHSPTSSTCSSSSPTHHLNAATIQPTAMSGGKIQQTSPKPSWSFTFGAEAMGKKAHKKDGDGAQSLQGTDAHSQMIQTLDQGIEALSASLADAACNAGVAAS